MQIQQFIIIILLSTTVSLCAQEGIYIGSQSNQAPDSSAILETESDHGGVLMPRVNLESTSSPNPITTTPALGLLVFNLVTDGDVVPGFYYWNGYSWQAWGLNTTGGSGSSSGQINMVNKYYFLNNGIVISVNMSNIESQTHTTINGADALLIDHKDSSPQITIPLSELDYYNYTGVPNNSPQ